MRLPLLQFVAVFGLLSGCASQSGVKSQEVLDEHTGVTVGALQEPLEFVEAPSASLGHEKRTSFAYLGPLDWDRSGDSTYGLWLHIAPGNDRPIADIHMPGTVTVALDDGPLVLTPLDAASAGGSPYRAIASWGQTGYFTADPALLKRLAASNKIVLHLMATNGSTVDFTPTHDTRATLATFVHSRGITDD